MSKTVLLATEKPFSAAAGDEVVAIIKQAGYTARVLESYKGKGPLLEAIADADAAIIRSDIIDQEVLDAAKQLKLVVRAGAGYDNIDCAAAKAKGVKQGDSLKAKCKVGGAADTYVMNTDCELM